MASRSGSAFSRFLNAETGPKTVHFWAPVMKWALVIAGLKDMQRPVEKVSGTQQIALMATGFIWTRWSMVIKPKNYLLGSVNLFLGSVAGFQVARLFSWRRSLGETPVEAVQSMLGKQHAPKPQGA